MAEVLGIVSAVIGFAPLVKGLKSGIDTLRQVRDNAGNIPVEIEKLTDDLYCLLMFLQTLERTYEAGDPFLQHCKTCCDEVAEHLKRIEGKFSAASGKRFKAFRQISAARGLKEDFEKLDKSLTRAQRNMYLASSSHVLTVVASATAVPVINVSQDTDGLVDESSPGASESEPAESEASDLEASDDAAATHLAPDQIFPRPIPPIRRGCWQGSRQCHCRRHNNAKARGSSWPLEFTPVDSDCGNKNCSARTLGGSLKVKLAPLGLRWSIIIQAQVVQQEGFIALRHGWVVDRIMPSNSPGFLSICRYFGGTLSFENARNSLRELSRNDPTFRNHVDTKGRSYVQLFLKDCFQRPYSTDVPEMLPEMINFLVLELRLTKGWYDIDILEQCKDITGSNFYITQTRILDHLVQVGFDPMDSPWPLAESFRPWRSTRGPSDGPGFDPCFMELMSILPPEFQGHAGMTPLHVAVLDGAVDSVGHWVLRSPPNERNFMGQSPLHMGIHRPHLLSILVDSGADIDAQDYYGMTPLMYAAQTGAIESASILLKAGADTSKKSRIGYDYVLWAVASSCWRFILKALSWTKMSLGDEAAQSVARKVTALFAVHRRNGQGRYYPKTFKNLIVKCGSPDFVFTMPDNGPKGCTLLFGARSTTDVDDILASGFSLINHVNSEGMNALMYYLHTQKLRDQHPVSVVKALLAAGCDAQATDHRQRGALRHAFDFVNRSSLTDYTSGQDIALALVQAGADCVGGDSCRCPCSPQGCLPHFGLPRDQGKRRPTLSVSEWVSLVLEHRGTGEARPILLSDIRRLKHEELGMTHVCCSRYYWHNNSEIRLAEEDVDEIIEEESDFNDLLDQEMDALETLEFTALKDIWIRSALRCQ